MSGSNADMIGGAGTTGGHGLHPVVALAVVVTVIGFLAGGGWPEVAVAGLGGLALVPASPQLSMGSLAATLWRLRFFYLSIAFLYVGFTPGPPLFPSWGAWSPSWPGMIEGLERVAILAAIVMTVRLFMAATPADELVASLRWWLRPLARVGGDPDRLALRLMLVSRALPRLRALAATTPGNVSGSSRWRRLGARAAALMRSALEEAETAVPPTVELAPLAAPRPLQWLPLAGAVAVLVVV